MTPPPACSPKASYVYLIQSIKTGKFYLGWTTDIERRLEEHNTGLSTYTKSRGPWKLIHYEKYDDPDAAKNRERKLKTSPNMYFLFKKRALANKVDPAGQRQVVG